MFEKQPSADKYQMAETKQISQIVESSRFKDQNPPSIVINLKATAA